MITVKSQLGDVWLDMVKRLYPDQKTKKAREAMRIAEKLAEISNKAPYYR